MGLFDRFRKNGDAALEQGRVTVAFNPETGDFHADVQSPLAPHEIRPAVEETLTAIDPLTRARRAALIESWIREKTKESKLMDKLARRASRWEAQARARLPLETFTGKAAEGFVEVTVDGTLAFKGIAVHDGARAESAFALAEEALRAAEELCRARYNAVLEGALDEGPTSDDSDVGLAEPDGSA